MRELALKHQRCDYKGFINSKFEREHYMRGILSDSEVLPLNYL